MQIDFMTGCQHHKTVCSNFQTTLFKILKEVHLIKISRHVNGQKSYQRITTNSLIQMKRWRKDRYVTAYDCTFRDCRCPGIDVILVGDSASNVIAGHETTLPLPLTNDLSRRLCCSCS